MDARARRALFAAVVVGAMVASGVYVLATSFSLLATYDDEGFFMMTVQHLLHGARLYDDVPVLYGPVYYLERWLLHGAIGLPLTHDVVRLISAGHWLAAAIANA